MKDKKPHISRGEWEVMDLFKGGRGAVMGFYEGGGRVVSFSRGGGEYGFLASKEERILQISIDIAEYRFYQT